MPLGPTPVPGLAESWGAGGGDSAQGARESIPVAQGSSGWGLWGQVEQESPPGHLTLPDGRQVSLQREHGPTGVWGIEEEGKVAALGSGGWHKVCSEDHGA